MTSDPTPTTPGRAPRWPLVLWLVQLAIAVLLAGPTAARLVRGSRLDARSLLILALAGGWTSMILAMALWPAGRQWLVRARFQLLLGLASFLISGAIVGELGVRLLAWSDIDGNRKFRTIVLRPLKLPLRSTQQEVERYLASQGSTTVYDAELGWAPRPSQTSQWYSYNAAAIRVADPGHEFAEQSAPGTLRIALFGDSFTQGAEVPFAESWGAQLEQLVGEQDRACEVLNFGVGGYGMDQALLRWQTQGRKFHPHVVLFGFQPENIDRNVNLIRRLYQIDSGNPLSKPRFIRTADGLRVLNQPCLPPDKLVETLRQLDRWELVQYEECYDPRDYRGHLWQQSLFAQVVVELLTRGEPLPPTDFSLGRERIALALAILQAFAVDAQASGARFAVVHLPNRDHLVAARARGALPYGELLQAIEQISPLVHTEAALLKLVEQLPDQDVFQPAGHYGPAANAVVATQVYQWLHAAEPHSSSESTAR